MGNVIRRIIEQPGDPLGGASGEKRKFGVDCIGKTDNEGWPFTIANEVVATQIGQALGLNLPTVLTHKTEVGEEWALIEYQNRVPKTASWIADYIKSHPQEVHGAIIFDLFVANNDRAFGPQRRNVSWDDQERMLLIDQGNACFYRNRDMVEIKAGIPRLDAVEKSLAAMNDMADKGNVYFQFLRDWKLVDFWCDRIRRLPDFLFEAAVGRIPSNFSRPTPAERARLVQFLIARKEYLCEHIIECRELMFPDLPAREDHAA
jgi:hypothetical protein